jgi:hypothetical protein
MEKFMKKTLRELLPSLPLTPGGAVPFLFAKVKE